MKKWVFGCLALFLVVAVGGGYAAYHFLYKPARAYVTSFTQLKVVPELNAQVANQATFTAPAGNSLTADRVARLVRTQQAVQTRMGERIKELEIKYKSLGTENNTTHQPSFGEALSALKDVTGLFVDAKRAQIEALNREGFSLAEYEWTRARAYEALGLPIDTTLQQVIREASAGKVPDVKAIINTPPVAVPEENRQAISPFAKELTANAALAFFAL